MTVMRVEPSNSHYMPDAVDYITIESSFLKRRADVSLYGASSTLSDLPIIVLLHGVYGNHWVWMGLGGVDKVYRRLREQGLQEFVLVMPSDGGLMQGSGYLPLDEADYEKWIVDDVISCVKEHYDCVSDQSPVYLSGLSMGGYGALRLGAKYPDRIAAISAHSSITKLDDFSFFINEENHQQLRGNHDEHKGDLISWLVQNKEQLPPIRFDCGQSDELYKSHCELEKAMIANGIGHECEHLSGGHAWEYWHENVARSFWFFHHHFHQSI